MKKSIIIVSFLLATSQLLSQKKIDLTSDKALTKVFNETEIQGLESMIKYVDDMVLNRENTTEANKAYHLYFKDIAQTQEYIVPFEENPKYEFLESLDSIQFSSIWTFDYHYNTINKGDTVYRNLEDIKLLSVSTTSKYMDYLEEIGKEDPFFNNLHRDFVNIGNVSAGTYNMFFIKRLTNFDFNIPKNRLWAAICLLGMEEPIEKKLDRSLKNK
ncbi:hypothetical protein [Zobellia galactanivorans]|uniref:Hypothetical periplasmic protein n=1 Tax=Zobellia galactanivorans (strain DSM 12802 / CCUG 47099 / CIP 106680 / NCIMB 13871 / Dsij) TaxID=63186 RepID=G0L6P1_ZOBGA|nr:hypothetical protein [Zobellia galactanivorans]CAZ98556.1 Hypothetical periplasmic protein [Zobellia galactanivorans]